MCNKAHQFQGQKSKVNVTKTINAVTESVSYLPKGKTYEIQIWYTDGARRPVSRTSAVTSKVKSRSQGHVIHLTGVGPLVEKEF